MNREKNSYYLDCLKSNLLSHFVKNQQKSIVKKETLLFETR